MAILNDLIVKGVSRFIGNIYGNLVGTINGFKHEKDLLTTSELTDTKNTAGSTNTSSKIFLVGATSQAANPQTYSHDTAYVNTDGKLHSNSKEVVNLSDTQALTNKTYNGYTLAAACAKGVVTSIDTSANLPTSNAVKTFVEGKVSKSGDTMTGKLVLKQGSAVTSAVGTNGTQGFVKIATITISSNYINTPIEIKLTRRNDPVTTTIYILFQSTNNNNPGLDIFEYSGLAIPYLQCSDTSTWDLYIEKNEANDQIDVLNLHKPGYLNDKVSIEWQNSLVSNLPSGYIRGRHYVDRKTYAIVGANEKGWYKFASGTMVSNTNINIVFSIMTTHSTYQYGTLLFQLRAGTDSITVNNLKWLDRYGVSLKQVALIRDGLNWELYIEKQDAAGGKIICKVINDSGVCDSGNKNLFKSSEYYNLHSSSSKTYATDDNETEINAAGAIFSEQTYISGFKCSQSFGLCSTPSTESEKVVSVSGTFVKTPGSIVSVRFNESVASSAFTLNVNDTGASPVTFGSGSYAYNIINQYDIVTFMYASSGTGYIVLSVAPNNASYLRTNGNGIVTSKATFTGGSNISYDSNTAPSVVIGTINNDRIEIDRNEITSKSSNHAPASLYLNPDHGGTGGKIYIGNGGLSVGSGGLNVNGNISINSRPITEYGNFIITTNLNYIIYPNSISEFNNSLNNKSAYLSFSRVNDIVTINDSFYMNGNFSSLTITGLPYNPYIDNDNSDKSRYIVKIIVTDTLNNSVYTTQTLLTSNVISFSTPTAQNSNTIIHIHVVYKTNFSS